MDNLINKPRVFLSHSSIDKPFIHRLDADLRRCQIETWVDEFEIRHGKSWLDVIFRAGIPKCDSVLLYLTENSLKSKVVAKEMDSGILHQLNENGVAFLPYVASADLRKQLRIDLQTLHCVEWNDSNYDKCLPTVVAEIWHSYLERVVSTATLQEKNKRLELELEVNRLKQEREGSIFTPNEEKEFKLFSQKLSGTSRISLGIWENRVDENVQKKIIGYDSFDVPFLPFLFNYLNFGYTDFDTLSLGRFIGDILTQQGYPKNKPSPDLLNVKWEYAKPLRIDLYTNVRLQTYGLIIRNRKKNLSNEEKATSTPKMFRFKFWLDLNEDILPAFDIKYGGFREKFEQ